MPQEEGRRAVQQIDREVPADLGRRPWWPTRKADLSKRPPPTRKRISSAGLEGRAAQSAPLPEGFEEFVIYLLKTLVSEPRAVLVPLTTTSPWRCNHTLNTATKCHRRADSGYERHPLVLTLRCATTSDQLTRPGRRPDE